MQFPVAVPGLDRDDVAAPNFFCLSRISVGYEWDRAPEFESDIGLLHPEVVIHGRAYGGRRRDDVGDR